MVTSFQDLLCKQILNELPNVKLIYLFGSHASKSNTSDSDIDVAILCDNKLSPVLRWNVAQMLADTMNAPVDLIDLLSASTVMQNEIVNKSICIYDKGQNADEFAMQVMSMYQHLNEERAEILAQFMKVNT